MIKSIFVSFLFILIFASVNGLLSLSSPSDSDLFADQILEKLQHSDRIVEKIHHAIKSLINQSNPFDVASDPDKLNLYIVNIFIYSLISIDFQNYNIYMA
jgi:hypothetical protein